MSDKKLDIGCGSNKPQGEDWVGLDIVDTADADIVFNLEDTPQEGLPFEDNEFREVRAHNVLEHLTQEAYIEVLREISRITVEGGRIVITGPHYMSWNAPAGDHFRSFSQQSMNCFSADHEYVTHMPQKFEIEDIEFKWTNSPVTRWLRKILPDYLVRRHVPNAVDEVTFHLKNNT